jgi:CRISPR type IV-associated protein Csf1
MALAANKVHTRQGSFVLTKDAERVAFFLQPPSPPYVVVLNEGTNTLHHAWCAEVTLDNEQIAVRFGKQNLIIRHSKLMKAVELCEEAAQLLNENNNSKNKVKKVFTHPYKVLDRNLSDLNHGQFKDDSLLLAHTNPRMAEILDILSDNTLGETWALAALVKAKKEEPVINQFKPVC